MGKDQRVAAWRCGRLRGDGSRCTRVHAFVIPEEEGRWRLRARGASARLDQGSMPPEWAAFASVADRWFFDCHPRCGAHYTFTNARVQELASRGEDLYLADLTRAM